MSTNISKEKREDLLSKISVIDCTNLSHRRIFSKDFKSQLAICPKIF